MPGELVVPYSGELVLLEDPAQCVRVIYEIRELKLRIKELESALTATLFEESQKQGTKTMHFGPHDVVVSTPATITWDQDILLELREAGLSEERFDELVTVEISYKVNRSVANSISSANPTYAAIIERAQTRMPRPPAVSVTPTKREVRDDDIIE